ncbi:hypothetical protein GCM10022206_25030 [Streptomyces chiangmaiensis]
MGTGTPVLTPGDGGHGQAAPSETPGPAVQTLPTMEVFAALDTSPRGLASADAAARRDRLGPNELPAARRRKPWRDLARQFTDLFAVMLLAACASSVWSPRPTCCRRQEFHDRDLTLYEQRERLTDIAKAAAATAEELMSTPAITVHPDVTLVQAARIMAVRHVKRLPLVDDEDVLKGIVSRGGVLKVFLRSDDDIEEEVRRTVVFYLFPALSHTINVNVHEGVVALRGQVQDNSLISVAARLVRAVEGVVDVEPHLTGKSGAPAGPEGTQ